MSIEEAHERVCKEYISKCEYCDECIAEYFCIEENRKHSRQPEPDCWRKLQDYLKSLK